MMTTGSNSVSYESHAIPCYQKPGSPFYFISSVCFGSTGCPKCLVSSVLPLEKSSRTFLPLVDSVDTHCALLSGGRYEENFDTFHVFSHYFSMMPCVMFPITQCINNTSLSNVLK